MHDIVGENGGFVLVKLLYTTVVKDVTHFYNCFKSGSLCLLFVITRISFLKS